MTTDPPPRPCHAIHRLPLGGGRTFADARQALPYLADLGVSHLALPQILAAADDGHRRIAVTDPTTVDPALGGEDALRELATAAHGLGIGLLADLVPGYLATRAETPLWDRLLAEGQSSDAAKAFDVDWATPLPGAQGKVVVPALDEPYGHALAAGHLIVEEDAEGGPRIRYGDQSFPINAEARQALERVGADALRGEPGQPRTWTRMHSLLDRQHYRLVDAVHGRRLVNYRRHPLAPDLAAVRAEEPVVFAQTHERILALLHDGVLDGLRILHLDGLADPGGYLTRLREHAGPRARLVVDLLGASPDALPDGWPVAGTTGRDTLAMLLQLQIDPRALPVLDRLAADLGTPAQAADRWRWTAEALQEHLGPDLRQLARALWTSCQEVHAVRDVDYRSVLAACTQALIVFPTVRTFVDPEGGEARDRDRQAVATAIQQARTRLEGEVPDALWTHLGEVLSGERVSTAATREVLRRFQTLAALTRTAAADLSARRHTRLLAATEIGVDPWQPARDPDDLHRLVAVRPTTADVATALPDARFGEDARLRLAVLSEIPNEWAAAVERWRHLLAPLPDGPLLATLQQLVARWPTTDTGEQEVGEVLGARQRSRLVTALAAGAPDGWASLLERALDPARSSAFLADLREFAVRVGEVAMVSGLSQLLLRCTLPGPPETAAGTEWWQLDPPAEAEQPPVGALRAALADVGGAAADALWDSRRTGSIKHALLAAVLRLRRERPHVLGPTGAHEPVATSGRWARHLVVYRRGADDGHGQVLVIAPRRVGRVTDGGRFPALGRIWADTDVHLDSHAGWRDVLTGRTMSGPVLAVADALSVLPVALLTSA